MTISPAGSSETVLLQQSWRQAWAAVGAAGDGEVNRQELLRRYNEPHRHYHVQRHLVECLELLENFRHLAERPSEIVLALWFHDAVYDPLRHNNEEVSASLAQSVLTNAGVKADIASRVAELVWSTNHGAVPIGSDAALLVDIDLSILAAPRARFIEYERQVREEYSFAPEAVFWKKRSEILQAFLNRPTLYSTPLLRDALEAKARENLIWSIEEASRVHVVTKQRAEIEGYVLGGFVNGGEDIRSRPMDRSSVLLVREPLEGKDDEERFLIYVKPECLGDKLWSDISGWLAPKATSRTVSAGGPTR